MNSKIGRAAFWIFLLTMLLLARDTLITSVILGFNRSQFLMLGCIGVAGLGFLYVQRNHLKPILSDKRIRIMGVFTLMLILPMCLKQDWQMMYFSILLCLLFAVFLTFFRSLKEVAKVYTVLLTGLCLYSLVSMYLLKDLAASGTLMVPQVKNSNGWPFYNFGLSYVVTWEYWNRNFGIFREPGVYQYFILLGLYLNNYEADWKKPLHLWTVNFVLTVTMFSTYAVGGFAELGLLAVFVYIDKKWYRTHTGKLAGAAVAATVAAIVGYVVYRLNQPYPEYSVVYEFYDMFIRLFTKSESSTDRMGAIATDVQLFLQNPLFGAGIAQVLHAVPNNTSSTLILYAILGVVGGTFHVMGWAVLIWKKERTLIGNLLLLLILFMSFNTQNLTADIFFWLFPVMALTQWLVPMLENRKKKV